ncbi:MAG: hypothetical protein U1F70_02940 [Candidatus Competibacteraceae bacterium]
MNHQDQGALDQFESRIRALITTDDLTFPPESVGDSSEPFSIKNFIIFALKAFVTGAATETGKQVLIASLKLISQIFI